MNIGIVTTWFERGAAYVSKQYIGILEKENNVFIYARSGEEFGNTDKNWSLDNVTWDHKWSLPIETFIYKKNFISWITKNKIEIVLFNEQRWLPPIIWCNELGVKTGAYIDYYTETTIQLFNIYDFLICNTMRHYDVFKWHPQCFYIPWGTDIDLFKPSNKKVENERELVFFHSSGMNAIRKGTDILIKAFYKLKSEAKLLIHTQKELKFKENDINEMMIDLIADGRLNIIKKNVHAPGLYYLGDVYVYPTRLEGIGLTIAEAISSGLPIIVPDYPPMNEFVNAKNGQLIRIDKVFARSDGYYWPQCMVDEEDLKLKMKFYIDNIKFIENFKKNSRNYAEDKLNWNINANKLNSIFKTIEKRNPKGYDEEKIQILKHSTSSYRSFIIYITKYPRFFNSIINIYRRIF